MTTHEQISLSPVTLTQELARKSEGAYRTQAIELLHQTAYAGIVWDTCARLGFIKSVELQYSPASHYSPKTKSICLGVDPPKHRKRTLLKPEFSYEQKIVYVLGHESVHALLPNLEIYQPALCEIRRAAKKLHSAGSGFTILSNLDHYRKKGPFVQAVEDVTELTAMYLWDPSYLSKYFDFLASEKPEDLARKQTENLITLPRIKTQAIEETISDGIASVRTGEFENRFKKIEEMKHDFTA